MTLTKIDDRGLKTPIDLLDNEKIRFGTGNDLEIYHNGTDSIIDNNTNKLYVLSDKFRFNNLANDETCILAGANSNVQLYYDNSKKFETTSSGSKVTGKLEVVQTASTNSAHIKMGTSTNQSIHLELENDGSADIRFGCFGSSANTFGNITANNGFIHTTNDLSINAASDTGNVKIGIGATPSTKLLIDSSGNVSIPNDSGKLKLGTGNDLEIFHDGSHSYIKDTGTGELKISSNKTWILNAAGDETIAIFNQNSPVELYYDNVKKFETSSAGAKVSGELLVESANERLILKDTTGTGNAARPGILFQDSAATNQFFVGNGASDSTDLYIQNYLNSSIIFRTNNTDRVRITNGGLDPETDAATDLGNASKRWRDLYLSSGVFLGGTGASNELEDYEEGNYSPTLENGEYTINGSYNQLQYTKIGRMVHVSGRLRITAKGSPSGDYIRMTLPTTSATLGEDRGRVTGTVYVQNSGKAVNDYVVLPTAEGNSYVDLAHVDYDGTGFNNMNSQFSGDELVSINITYVSA